MIIDNLICMPQIQVDHIQKFRYLLFYFAKMLWKFVVYLYLCALYYLYAIGIELDSTS